MESKVPQSVFNTALEYMYFLCEEGLQVETASSEISIWIFYLIKNQLKLKMPKVQQSIVFLKSNL